MFKTKSSGIEVGRIRNSIFGREVLTDAELAHHVHVVGASGFGKSVFLSKIVKHQIREGKGLMFVDLKGDIELIERFKTYAREAGREDDVQIFNLNDLAHSKTYNLLGHGTATQTRDRIMMSFTWSEEFYKHQASSFLLKALIGLCYIRDSSNKETTIKDLYQLVNERDEIRDLLSKIPREEKFVVQAVTDILKFSTNESNWNSLQGLRAQLESIVLSDFGKLVTSENSEIDLFKAIEGGELVFLFLDTRRYSETAKTIGRFVLQDLKAVSAKIDSDIRMNERKPFSVIIDEFADLAQEDFIAFLDRARSSKMSIVVSHQEISDLKSVSPEFAMRLMGNTSTLYAFLQKGPESADMIASVAGTKTVIKKTYQTGKTWLFEHRTGNGSIREVEEFVIHPNVIKSLTVGECAVVKKYPFARAHIARVEMDI